MLTVYKSSKTSWALLQAILVALETPRSQRGLQALARHSNTLTSALLAFLDCTMQAHHAQGSRAKSVGQTAAVSVTPLQAALDSFHRHQAESIVPASDSTAGQTDTLSQQQQQQQQQFDRLRSASLPQLRQESLGPNARPLQPTADAEREQRVAQLQQQEWQRKEAAYQAELSLAQTNNAKLHEQVHTVVHCNMA